MQSMQKLILCIFYKVSVNGVLFGRRIQVDKVESIRNVSPAAVDRIQEEVSKFADWAYRCQTQKTNNHLTRVQLRHESPPPLGCRFQASNAYGGKQGFGVMQKVFDASRVCLIRTAVGTGADESRCDPHHHCMDWSCHNLIGERL